MKFFLFELWSGLARRKDTLERKEIITALRDWKILLIFSMAIMVVVAAGNAYLYFKINNEQLFQGEAKAPSTAVTIDRESLERVIKEFKEKAGRFDGLSRQAPQVNDPSIITH